MASIVMTQLGATVTEGTATRWPKPSCHSAHLLDRLAEVTTETVDT